MSLDSELFSIGSLCGGLHRGTQVLTTLSEAKRPGGSLIDSFARDLRSWEELVVGRSLGGSGRQLGGSGRGLGGLGRSLGGAWEESGRAGRSL